MGFSAEEQRTLREHGIALFRDKLILDAQPPISEPARADIERRIQGPVPQELLALWSVSYGGKLDYDLHVRFGEREYPASFTELFFPDSSHYHDIFGWIDEESEGQDRRIEYLPFGGFEYSERMYCKTSPPDQGSVHLWAQGLPPAWKLRLTEDSTARVADSVSELFDRLSLDNDPWNAEEEDFARGADLVAAIEGLRIEQPGLAERLSDLVSQSVFDWRSAVMNADFGADLSPTVERAMRLALHQVAREDDIDLLRELLARGCPLYRNIQDRGTPLALALHCGSFRAAEMMLGANVPLGTHPVVGAEGISATLLDRLIADDVPFDAAVPMNLAQNGEPELALRVVNNARRDDPRAWKRLRKTTLQIAERCETRAENVRNGRYISSQTPEESLEEAQRLRDFAARLPADEALNPWFSIWTRPRATIEEIVETNPKRLVVPIMIAFGLAHTLGRANRQHLGDSMDVSVVLASAALRGALFGLAWLYLGGSLLHWTGRWLGGRALLEEARAALAWSSVPMLWGLLLWVPAAALFGGELFTSHTPTIDANLGLRLLSMGFTSVELVLSIWAFVVFLKCLAQVQGFSAWRALGNAILAFAVGVVPFIAVTFVVALLAR